MIDYFIVSFQSSAELSTISQYLFRKFDESTLAEFYYAESDFVGFKSVYTNGKLFLHFENRGVKDIVLFEIKSKGCRFLESKEYHSWVEFFQLILEAPSVVPIERATIKRLDVAIDHFDDTGLTPKRAKKWLHRKLITSRFRTIRVIEETAIHSGCLTGDSVYIGKRSSDLSLVIYDKQLEAKTDQTWNRTELRFKNMWGSRAVEALIQSPNDFSKFISGVLRQNLQFRSMKGVNEYRRRDFAGWYKQYLKKIDNQTLHSL